jgi:hypothetical protein
VNSKFQIIQSAVEVLGDTESKAKYDAQRVKSNRYPTASGVRGNPWQNAGSQYPPPPQRRTASTRNANATSGANKYRNFASGVPPTAKAQPAADPMDAKRDRWQAFENMRPFSSSTRANHSQAKSRADDKSASSQGIPQTQGQKQKAEASFGNRKTGYHPRSSTLGDEPPVTSKNYATSRHTSNLFTETASNTSRRRNVPETPESKTHAHESYLDPRQSTPYQTHGGEKTNPFDGVPLSRARSTRETPNRDQATQETGSSPQSASRRRSSSMPKKGRPYDPSQYVPNGSGYHNTANQTRSSGADHSPNNTGQMPEMSGKQSDTAAKTNGSRGKTL